MVANRSLKDPDSDNILSIVLIYLFAVVCAVTSSFFW